VTVTKVEESRVQGSVPLFQVPGWLERYGVVAGITGRGEGPGRGFDLGLWSDAPVGEVMGRWRQFRNAFPAFQGWVLGHQVHRTRVVRHGPGTGSVTVEGVDGHVTNQPGLMLLVTVADCIPIYLVDPSAKAIGLLHSGWRGTSGGILARGVETMVEQFGSVPSNIVMHCGIGICGQCYEVGSEVMEGCGIRREGAGPWHIDLRGVLVAQAEGLGLGNISTSQLCSGHHRPSFYSHRASAGADGRMVAYLGLPYRD